MKPLPLLLSLAALALVGGLLLIGTRSQEEFRNAPLPPSLTSTGFDDNEDSLLAMDEPPPSPPLLSENLEPDPQLISYVEQALGRSFTDPPIFRPADENEIVASAQAGLNHVISDKSWQDLKKCALHLGFLPEFADLQHVFLTLAAAEVRGLSTAEGNLIRSDFDSGSPPEQAALVNLIARLLLSQGREPIAQDQSPAELIAGEVTQSLLALAVERQFRKGLPDYPPSLNENMRESIMLGVPSFFHELASFSEFQLLDRLATHPLPEVVAHLSAPGDKSLRLLSYPESPREQSGEGSYYLGPIPLQIILLEATTAEEARELATTLVSDSIGETSAGFVWRLTFENAPQAKLAEGLMEAYFSFRKQELNVSLHLDGPELNVTTSIRN